MHDAELRQRGQTVSQVRRKERKLGAEVGPLRFEMHTLTSMRSTSSSHGRAISMNGPTDCRSLNYPRTVRLLDAVRRHQSDRFSRGDVCPTLAESWQPSTWESARSNGLHIWFPTYTRTSSSIPPGLISACCISPNAAAADGSVASTSGMGDVNAVLSSSSSRATSLRSSVEWTSGLPAPASAAVGIRSTSGSTEPYRHRDSDQRDAPVSAAARLPLSIRNPHRSSRQASLVGSPAYLLPRR